PIYGMDNEDNYAFAFIEKAPQPIELNPELYVLIDNLQIRTPENRDLGVTLWPLSGSLIPINLEDQPARAFGVAIRNEFWPNTGDFWLTENNVALGLDFPDDDLSQPLPSSFSETGKPFLEYVEDADAMRLASAFRRSPSSYTTTRYWCLANRDPSPDSAVCRPTLNDWTSTVQSVAVETRSCNICQNGVNCDATCNAETHKKPDGTPCFNSCTAPLCYSAIQCNPETHTRQVDVLGRHTLTWLNSSPLVPAVLYAANGDENARDAPFKFFSDFTSGSFKYTMATLVKQQCADSNSRDSFGKSDTCFSDQGTMAKLSQFGPVPEGVMNQWFGNPNPSSQDFGSLKLSEEQGGCSQSARWDRGYYAVTFTYEKDSDDVQGNSWKWSYAAEPLEVSSNYGQLNTETDLKSCRVTSLTGGRNTKLCYAIFATNVTNEAGKPGQCIRSLRDYIPLIPDAENNLNIIRADKLAPLQTEPVEYIGALKQQIPTGGIYLRDMDVQLGKAKCNFFDDIPANVVQTTCVGGNDCFLPLPLSLIMGGPFFPVADFNASTVGITQGGKADWITEFKQDDRAADQKCYDAFHISGVPNPLRWTGDGSDMSYSLRYSGRGVDGSALQISENSDNMCFAACRIVCSTYPYC
ncbi:MAG: hypothetical protein Q8R15_04260, partial [Candidatus Micrarchaeota archaeon]|nr:hypothetical protein [Candidatus Micrarchaeota archaeon]